MEVSAILAALRAFEAAARHQNLSQAARELNVTHAAISQHVRKLEEELGEPLLLRQGRGMALTDAGALVGRQSWGMDLLQSLMGSLRCDNADRTGRFKFRSRRPLRLTG